MKRTSFIIPILISAISVGLASCASISESDCLAGSWSDIGYKDGVRGKQRGKLANYAKTCSKYGVLPDRQAYLTAFEQGVTKYCTYERGYERGENGNDFNQVCADKPQSGFAEGYDAGRVVYEIYSEHENLISAYENRYDAIIEVERKLSEDELPDKERKRLRSKLYRLENEAEDLRIDIRAYERLYDLPRHGF